MKLEDMKYSQTCKSCKLCMWTILALDFETGSWIGAVAFAFLGLCSCVSESESDIHMSTVYALIYCHMLHCGTRALMIWKPMRDFQMFKSSASVHMPNCRCPESIHRRIMSLTKRYVGQEKKQVPNQGGQCSAWGEDCTAKGNCCTCGDKCIQPAAAYETLFNLYFNMTHSHNVYCSSNGCRDKM